MDKEKLLYPLLASQKFFYSALKECPEEQLLNIGTSLTLKLDIDFNVLKESIYEAYDHCECMRIQFTHDSKGKIMQYIVPKEERDISFFEFAYWKQEDAENEMRKWTAVPFKRFDSPMNKIVMISMPEGFKGMYMLVDHMIMDAQALLVFFKDVIEIYCSKKFGMGYPKPLQSFIKSLEKDLKYSDNSKAYQKDKKYWEYFIKESEPIYTDITGKNTLELEQIKYKNPNLRAAACADGSYNSDIVSFHLEPDPSDVLVDFCIKNNISMVCLLLMALRTYLQKVNNNEPDVSISSAIARRATLLEKFSGGSRVQFFPCRTIVQTNETFIDGCRKIQESQNQIFRHANFDASEFLQMRNKYYNLKPGQTYEPISLTYQPLSFRSGDLPDITYKSNWYCNGAAAQNIYLTVMHGSLDNGLDFVFEHRKEKFNYEDLQKIYYFVTRILFEGVSNPNETIAEVIFNT